MTFGERVKQERKAQGMTQQELADAVGVSKMTIRRIEAGQTVSLQVALNIAAELYIDDEKDVDIFLFEKQYEESLKSEGLLRIVSLLRKLNRRGREVAESRIEELTEIPRYTKPDDEQEE